jgi:cell division transport system permease protein
MSYLWRETFSNIKYSGIMGILSIMVVILTTTVLSILLILANYIQLELKTLKQSPLVVVFLNDNLDDSSLQNIQKSLESMPQIKSSKYISKQDALEKTRKLFSERKEVLDGLESINPLPSSFEIELKPQFLGEIQSVVESIKSLPGVDDIQNAERTSQLVLKLETGLIFVGSILGLASVIIICFSIMQTTYIRREEIKIMRLVGSTGLFIRIPLLLQGVMQGLIGSAIGLGILYASIILLESRLGMISFLPRMQIILMVGVGTFMGFIAGIVPLRRFIKI